MVCMAHTDNEPTQAEDDPRTGLPHQVLVRIEWEVIRLWIFYELK